MIRIGHIDYANCTPIFTALQRNFDCSGYSFVKGVPSALNSMLNRGEIDLCPASSIEYAKNPDRYLLLPNLSISSIGPVQSVLLFSRAPIAELDGHVIGLTTESETSVNLIKIILAKRYGFSNTYENSRLPVQDALKRFGAILLIGDGALKAHMLNREFFVYDLGALWLEFTGLPFVFALWLVTREAVLRNSDDVGLLADRLVAAKDVAYDAYEAIAEQCREKEWMGRKALIEYWRGISYDLSPRHVQGVATFYRYAAELQLLQQEPEIRMLS